MTGFKSEQQIIDQLFDTWVETSVVRENDDSDKGEEFIRVSTKPVDANRMNLGINGQYRYTNMLFVQIFVRAGSGVGRTKEIADLLTTQFRDVSTGGLIFKVPQLKTVGVDSGWHQSVFSVEFYREEL